MITLGTLCAAAALNIFLVPAQIAPGGASGIATILFYIAEIPLGLSIIVINIPLFLLGFKNIGREFFIKSLFATLLYSFLAEIITIQNNTLDPFLCVIYGGVLMGIGLGIVIRFGGSTGGTDLAAVILNKKFKGIGISTFVLIVDFFIVAASGILFSPTSALYALAAIFLSSKLIDFITEGISRARAFFIITQSPDLIGDYITEKLSRGATKIEASGVYTKVATNILLCVLPRSNQHIKLRDAIKELDPNAFVISAEVRETYGKGFSEL